jgi:hypothetical protein
VKNARHAVKVMLVFALLEREAMPVDEVAAYVERVPFYMKLSQRFLGLAPRALAEWLVTDLERTGAIAVTESLVRPTMAA